MSRFLWVVVIMIGVMGWQYARIEAMPTAGMTARVNVHTNGTQAQGGLSQAPALSANGRYIAFASDATNLVDGDTNGVRDIFVHDRETQITERVSVNSDGVQGNFASEAPAISDDGRFVTFHSFATNFLENDTNSVADIFVHDRQSGSTELVNIVLNGQANDISYDPDISADGRYITFWSYASNLVGGDDNGSSDIFWYDRIGRVLFRVSVDSNGVPANGSSRYPTISDDGRYLAFESDATNLVPGDGAGYRDIFWHDRQTGETRRVSVTSTGGEANGDSVTAVVSGNGRYVAFVSFAADLVSDDTNPFRDIFIHDTQDDTTQKVSYALENVAANTWEWPALSANGRYIAYQGRPAGPCSDEQCQIFVRDQQTGTTAYASVNAAGETADDASVTPAISADSRYIAFASDALNLVAGDTNGRRDIFIHDRLPPPTLTVNHTTGAPGSVLAFTGQHFVAGVPTDVRLNGLVLGTVTADSGGTIAFRLSSQPTTEAGGYFVTLSRETFVAYAGFVLRATAPLHPDAGSGPIFPIPDDSAYTHFIYLPAVYQLAP